MVHVLDVFLFTGKHRWKLTYNLGLLHVFPLLSKSCEENYIY